MKSTLLTQAFFDSLESSTREVDEAQMLPPACYVSDEFFEFEREALFCREWLCVGRESWLANPGDYFATAHAGEPILVTRDADGAIKVMTNVCQHRGMLVAEGFGNARTLSCPYHHWTYSLDGRLVAAPAMERARGFDKNCVSLARFKVETWLGFIFVNLDPEAEPLAPRLTVVTEALRNFELAKAEGPRPDPPTRFAWNWKVMMENNNDGYHANKLHAGPLHDVVPSHKSVFPDLPPDTAGYFRFNGAQHKDAGFNPTHHALLPIFPKLTDEERHRFFFGQVPPTLSLVIRPDQVTYMFLHAVSASELMMTRGWLVAPGARDTPLFKEKMEIDLVSARSIVMQDLHVDEMIPLGLRSRFAPRGRYSWQERSQREFNCWLVPRYRKAWERMKPAMV